MDEPPDLPGSPTEAWARGQCSATRRLAVPWQDRHELLRHLLGPSYRLGIILGADYPYCTALRAYAAEVQRVSTASGAPPDTAYIAVHYARPGTRPGSPASDPPIPTDANDKNAGPAML